MSNSKFEFPVRNKTRTCTFFTLWYLLFICKHFYALICYILFNIIIDCNGPWVLALDVGNHFLNS